MIYDIKRLGSEEDDSLERGGWFLVNNCVKIRYVETDEGLTAEIQHDEKSITDEDASALAEELLKEVLHFHKQ